MHTSLRVADRGLGQRIIQGVSDGADRRNQLGQHQRLGEMYCSVLGSGIRVIDPCALGLSLVEWFCEDVREMLPSMASADRRGCRR